MVEAGCWNFINRVFMIKKMQKTRLITVRIGVLFLNSYIQCLKSGIVTPYS